MNKFIKSTVLVSAMTVLTSVASAAPIMDKQVREFLNSSSVNNNQVLPVLLVYKQQAALPTRANHPRYHAEIEKALIQNAKQQEAALFKNSLVGNKRETLWIVNGTLTTVRQEQLKALSTSSAVATISYSLKKLKLITPKNVGSVANIAADATTYGLQKMKVPELRVKYPSLDGSGVRVGILDTGIDANHPDLAGKVKAFKDFTAAQSPTPSDENTHGTHVAGTIAGGATSGTSIGVAPKVQLIIGKIFDAQGSAKDEDILRAMQWIADPDGNPDTNDFPLLVSNSWGDDAAFDDKDPQDEPLCVVVDNWVKLGMLPVFAAGNAGPSATTVGLPGGCPAALTIGATDSNDKAAYFSSRGPAKWKSSSLVKPDVAAPGVNIKSAKPGGGYQTMSGTSMSTPHISGVMALLFQANPALTVDAAAKALLSGATDLGTAGKDNTFGWGRADVLKAVDLMKPTTAVR